MKFGHSLRRQHFDDKVGINLFISKVPFVYSPSCKLVSFFPLITPGKFQTFCRNYLNLFIQLFLSVTFYYIHTTVAYYCSSLSYNLFIISRERSSYVPSCNGHLEEEPLLFLLRSVGRGWPTSRTLYSNAWIFIAPNLLIYNCVACTRALL